MRCLLRKNPPFFSFFGIKRNRRCWDMVWNRRRIFYHHVWKAEISRLRRLIPWRRSLFFHLLHTNNKFLLSSHDFYGHRNDRNGLGVIFKYRKRMIIIRTRNAIFDFHFFIYPRCNDPQLYAIGGLRKNTHTSQLYIV